MLLKYDQLYDAKWIREGAGERTITESGIGFLSQRKPGVQGLGWDQELLLLFRWRIWFKPELFRILTGTLWWKSFAVSEFGGCWFMQSSTDDFTAGCFRVFHLLRCPWHSRWGCEEVLGLLSHLAKALSHRVPGRQRRQRIEVAGLGPEELLVGLYFPRMLNYKMV